MRRSARWLCVLMFVAVILATGCTQTKAPEAPATKASAPAAQATPAATPAPAAKVTFDRPIKVVVTHAAGGSTDLPARVLAARAEKILGQPVVMENMVGAGGVVARNYVYKAKPDGYTLLATQLPSTDMAVHTGAVEYDPMKFSHLYSITGRDYLATAVQADAPYKTYKEFMDTVKARKTTLSVGGAAGASQIAAALYQQLGGDKIRYVPFESGAPAGTALGGKHIDVVVTNATTLVPLQERGLIRILAVHGEERHPGYSNIPNVKELGYPELAVEQMVVLMGPPGMPADVVKALADAFAKAGQDPAFLGDLKKAGFAPQPLGPDEFLAIHKRINTQIGTIKDALKALK